MTAIADDNEVDDLELEDEQTETPAPTNGRATTRRPAKKKRARKKRAARAVAATPSAKVDPAQALAFVRSRIREAKEPIVKAFFEAELAELNKRVKADADARRARLSITVVGKKIGLGGKCYAIDDRYEAKRRGPGKPIVCEYTLKDVIQPAPGEYAQVKAVFAKAGGGNVTVEQWRYNKEFFADRLAAIDHELKECVEELKTAQAEVDELTARRNALLELIEPKLPLAQLAEQG